MSYSPENLEIIMSVLDQLNSWLHEPSYKAVDASEEAFPGQPWDSSQKNALRHSLATGLWTQRLGGTWLSGKAAQLMGQVWEATSPKLYGDDTAHKTDTLHDLNNNAVGAQAGQRTVNEESLINALTRMVKEAKAEVPPKFLESERDHLTYTKNK